MMNIKEKALDLINKYNMIKQGDRVAVGLSGGADSVALLCVMLSLKEELKIEVSACHVNHNLRGAESDGDESFCHKLCEKLGVKLYTFAVNAADFAKENKISLEMAARELRYNSFESLGENIKIATAHTASDNLETVLLNISRGTALEGLCGIPPVRDSFIRPLLSSTREEIESYLLELNQNYVTDSSNLTDDYNRNILRHRVLPVLKQINPSVEYLLSQNTRILREDEEYLFAKAQSILNKGKITREVAKNIPDRLKGYLPITFEYNKNVLLNQPVPILNRVIKQALKNIDATYSYDIINNAITLLKNGDFKLSVGKDMFIGCKGEVFYATKAKKVPINEEFELFLSSHVLTTIAKNRYYITISKTDISDSEILVKIQNKGFQNCIDCDKMIGSLTFRSRRDGDSIKLQGRNCTKSFKSLFNEKKIPPEIRDGFLVLCQNDKPIWLEGFGVAEEFSVNKNTKKIINITASEVF